MARRLTLLLLLILSCAAPAGQDSPQLARRIEPQSPQQVSIAGVDLSVFPTLEYPVDLHFHPLPGMWGMTQFDPIREVFLITINPLASDARQVDTLIHEWAHAMVWHATKEDPHGPLWGVAYARVYRAVKGSQVP